MYTKEEDLALMLFVRQNKDFHAIKGNSLYKKAAKAKVCNQHLIFIVIPLNIMGI